MSEEMKAGLTIAEKAQMQSDITTLKAQLAEAQKQADANKDGHVDQREARIWFKHAWQTPSGRKLIFNFAKSVISIIGCIIAMIKMGYSDPGLFWLFISIIITNIGMLTDASNETDMLNLLYSLTDAQNQLNQLQKK